jgi:hypothetical protein
MHRLKQQLNWPSQYGSFWSGVDGGTAFLIHQHTNSPGRGLNFGLCYLQNTNKHFPISNGTGHIMMAQHSTNIQTALHTRNEQERIHIDNKFTNSAVNAPTIDTTPNKPLFNHHFNYGFNIYFNVMRKTRFCTSKWRWDQLDAASDLLIINWVTSLVKRFAHFVKCQR